MKTSNQLLIISLQKTVSVEFIIDLYANMLMPTDVFPSHRPQKTNQYQFCLINIFSAKAFCFFAGSLQSILFGHPLSLTRNIYKNMTEHKLNGFCIKYTSVISKRIPLRDVASFVGSHLIFSVTFKNAQKGLRTKDSLRIKDCALY